MIFIEMNEAADHIAMKAASTMTHVIRQVPGVRYNSKDKTWDLPLSWASCVISRGILGAELQIGPTLSAWAFKEKERLLQLRQLRDNKELDDLGKELWHVGSDLELFPFQQVGASFMARAGQALNADEMGLGKTVQTITALKLLQAHGNEIFPVLIVAPNTIKRVWAREFEKWWPEMVNQIAIVSGGTVAGKMAVRKVLEGDAKILIMNYEMLPKLSRLEQYGSIALLGCSSCDPNSLRPPRDCHREPKILNEIPWHTVIADEAHRLISPKALWTRALWATSKKARYRFALTGTPIANHPGNLWGVMHFVSPDEYPRRSTWVNRYCLTVPNPYSGYVDIVGLKSETRSELDEYLLPRFLRRPKQAVLPDLPMKTYLQREVILMGKQKKAYDQFRRELVAAVNDGTIFTTNPLTETLRLRQLACSYAEALNDGQGGMLMQEPSSKIDELMNILEDLGGRQAVVFAEYSQLVKLAGARLEKANIPFVYVMGGIKDTQIDRNVQMFQNGERRVLLATLGSGSEGLTLTAADTAIFLQRSWQEIANRQAEDRIHRIGQEAENVTIIDIIARDTVDEHMTKVLLGKRESMEIVCKDKETLLRWLT